jgi:hypothetical protein
MKMQLAGLKDNKDNTVVKSINVDNIKKVFNPREIPCSLQEIRSIKWPSLDTVVDDIPNVLLALFKNKKPKFWTEADERKQKHILSFFAGIHELAQKIQDDGQIHNITVSQPKLTENDTVLISGERRVISCIYSGKLTIEARVYNYELPLLDARRIAHNENSGEPLAAYEFIGSLKGIWDALGEGREKLTNNQLQRIFNTNGSYASRARTIFIHKDCEAIYDFIDKERMSWHSIMDYIASDFGKLSDVFTVKTSEDDEEDELTTANVNAGEASSDIDKKSEFKDADEDVESDNSEKSKLDYAHKQNLKLIQTHGFKISRNTDLSVLKGVIDLLLDSGKIEPKTNEEVNSSMPINDYKSLVEVLVTIINSKDLDR